MLWPYARHGGAGETSGVCSEGKSQGCCLLRSPLIRRPRILGPFLDVPSLLCLIFLASSMSGTKLRGCVGRVTRAGGLKRSGFWFESFF